MEIILAIDIKNKCVVHGKSGKRDTYTPLNWGVCGSPDPFALIKKYRPRFIYIADLDMIEGKGDNFEVVRACALLVSKCYYDGGFCTPEQIKGEQKNIIPVIGTETCGGDLTIYKNCFLSIDIKDGKVIPDGKDLEMTVITAQNIGYKGCIILDISAVGTSIGTPAYNLVKVRETFKGQLLHGGGIKELDDLKQFFIAGFDGVIIATAIHKGIIPPSVLEVDFTC